MAAEADVAAGSLEAGVIAMVHGLRRAGLVEIGVDDGLAVDLDCDPPAFGRDLLDVPFAHRIEAISLCRDNPVNRAVELIRLELGVLGV